MKMDDDDILAWLGSQISQGINEDDGQLGERRKLSLDYYMGRPYGDEVKGRSKVVTREVFEAVEWALPLIIDALSSENSPVLFDPSSEEDIEQAEQETCYTRHVIFSENEGFVALMSWVREALLYPNGYLKVMPEEKWHRRIEKYRGLVESGLAEVIDDDTDVLEASQYVEDLGQGPVQLFDVKLRKKTKKVKICLEAVPPEQVVVGGDTRTTDLDKATFLAHRFQKTKTELLDLGYDSDLLDEVGTEDDHVWNDETINRLFHEDSDGGESEDTQESTKKYWVHECYGWLDADKDGVAEYRRFVTIGGTLFENEETDYQPLISLSTIIMPHQHAGVALAETVKDLQPVASTLLRNLLNNIYRINMPRTYVSESLLLEDGSTYDAMLDALAEVIPVRGSPHEGTKKEEMPSLVAEILPVLNEIRDRTATRTGVAPQLSLNPQILQEATMGAFMGALAKANERLDLTIRTIAETGIKRLFQKTHQLIREYTEPKKLFRIRGKWVPVMPMQWREREGMTVTVGLGMNNKQKAMELYTQVLGLQKESLSQGLSNPQKVYTTIEKMMALVGMNAFEHFVDPSSPEFQPPQPQPDPMIELTKQQIESQERTKMTEIQSRERIDMEKVRIDGDKLSIEQQKVMSEALDRDATAKERGANTHLTLVKAMTTEAESKSKTALDKVTEGLIQAQTLATQVKAQKDAVETEAQRIENHAVSTGLVELEDDDGKAGARPSGTE